MHASSSVTFSLLAGSALACSTHLDRNRELAQCRVASRGPQELVHCLAIDRNWPAESANTEGVRAQAILDSIADDSLATVALVVKAASDSAVKRAERMGEAYLACLRRGSNSDCTDPDMIGMISRASQERRDFVATCQRLSAERCLRVLDSDTSVFVPTRQRVRGRRQ